MNNKIQGIDKVILFFITFFFSHNSSFIAYYTPSFVWGGVVSVLFIVLIVWCSSSTDILRYLFPLVSIPLIVYFLKRQVYPTTLIETIASCLLYCVYPLITCYVLKTRNIKIAQYVIFLYLGIEIVTGVSTIRAYGLNEGFERIGLVDLQEQSMELYAYRMMLNVGNYYTAYGYAALLPLVIMAYKWRAVFPKSWAVGLFSLALALMMLYVVYISQYTIAFIISLIAFCLIFLNKNQSKNKVIALIIVGIVGALLLKDFIPTILRSLVGTIDSDIMSDRLLDLADSMEHGKNVAAEESDFNIRMRVYNKSIDTILGYPFIGAWNYKLCGEHSFVLDIIALMGVIGLVLLIGFYKTIINRYIKPYSKQSWVYFYVYSLFIITVFYVLNPSGMYEQMLFVLPVSAFMMNYYVEKNKRNIIVSVVANEHTN